MFPSGNVVNLPLYPWNKERHWTEVTAAAPEAGPVVVEFTASFTFPGGAVVRHSGSSQPSTVDAPKPARDLRTLVRDVVSAELRIAPDRLAPHRTLAEYGVDSLMSQSIRRALSTALDRDLPATLVWNNPTVDALVEFLQPPDATPFPTSSGRLDDLLRSVRGR